MVTFWLSTPILKSIDPHLVLATVVAVLLIVLYQRKKRKPQITDEDEQLFQALLKKRSIIEAKLNELQKVDSEGHLYYETDVTEYRKHLEEVNRELQEFTS